MGRRLWLDGSKALRGQLPWTRLAVPTLILFAAILVANNVIPRVLAALVLVAIDVAVLALCLWTVVSLQRSARQLSLIDAIESSLAAYFPPWFSKVVASDLVIVAHAVPGFKAFLSPVKPTAHSYVRGSKIALAAMIVAVSILPDAVLFEFVVPRHFWWAAIGLDVLNIWGCLWLYGVYGTMVRRPHVVSPDEIVFHNGVMQSIVVAPRNILRARSLGLVRSNKLGRKKGDESTVLTFGGVPLVEVTFKVPVRQKHLFSFLDRDFRTMYVASDEPAKFAAELEQSSKSERFSLQELGLAAATRSASTVASCTAICSSDR